MCFPISQSGSEEEINWKRRNPSGYSLHESSFTTGSTEVHQAAHAGDHATIKRLLSEKAELVNARDVNGWMPLHVSQSLADRFSVVVI